MEIPIMRKGALDKKQLLIKKIAIRIRHLRKDAGYSSAEKFAFEMKISRTQYARYERGEDMRLSSLLNVLTAHGLTLEEFCRGL